MAFPSSYPYILPSETDFQNDPTISREKTSTYWVGIDLGTSNSVLSVYQRSTQATLIPTETGSVLLPSVVHFCDDGSVLVGTAALNQAQRHPQRTIFGSKRLIGRKFCDPIIQEGLNLWPFSVVEGQDGYPLIKISLPNPARTSPDAQEEIIVYKTVVDIQSEILRYARLSLAQHFLHWDNVINIVITVPAYFNYNQRHCTIIAAHNAGFYNVRIINEPSSAAFYFGYKESLLADHLIKNILIYDFGGGTLDVSIIDVNSESPHGSNAPLVHQDYNNDSQQIENAYFRVVATDGDTTFGGFDIDEYIVKWMIKELLKKYNFDFYDPFFYQKLPETTRVDVTGGISHADDFLSINKLKLNTLAEKMKKELSALNRVKECGIILKGMFELLEKRGSAARCEDGFELALDRAILNKYFTSPKSPGKLKSIKAIQRCLKKAKLTINDINKVVLVGGSTRIPAIQKNLITFFNNNNDVIAKTINADEAVALGACIHAATLSLDPNQQLIFKSHHDSNTNPNTDELTKNIQLCDISPLAYGIYLPSQLLDPAPLGEHANGPLSITIPSPLPTEEPVYETFISRNTLLVKDQPIFVEKTLHFPYNTSQNTLKFQVLEYDDAVDSSELIHQLSAGAPPQTPSSPTPLDFSDLTASSIDPTNNKTSSISVLHNVILNNIYPIPFDKPGYEPGYCEITVSFKLTYDYELWIEVYDANNTENVVKFRVDPFVDTSFSPEGLIPPPQSITKTNSDFDHRGNLEQIELTTPNNDNNNGIDSHDTNQTSQASQTITDPYATSSPKAVASTLDEDEFAMLVESTKNTSDNARSVIHNMTTIQGTDTNTLRNECTQQVIHEQTQNEDSYEDDLDSYLNDFVLNDNNIARRREEEEKKQKELIKQKRLQKSQQSEPEPEPISLPSVQPDLIHGKPALWWDKGNWEEKEDPTYGIFYLNKVTGETTYYYDDFDLDSHQ